MSAREQVQKIQGFGLRLLNRLAALKMTQTTLSERTGISRQTLHRAIHKDELTGRVAKKIAGVVGSDLLSVDVGAPALALVLGGQRLGELTPAEPQSIESTIPSGAPDDAANLAGRLTALGEVLEILRRDDAVSQDAMAARATISLATYRRVITGQTRPKDSWLRKWGEVAELDDPDDMLYLKQFERGDAFYQAVGRQLHAWRVSAGLDLIDVADACGESVLTLAQYEAGWKENFLALDDLAPLYGTSSDMIFRAAVLTAPRDDDDRWRPPVERVLTFEAAQMHAYQQQEERDLSRARGGWDIMRSNELHSIRLWTGHDRKDVAKQLGVRVGVVDAWEDDEKEPTASELERMSILYRRTPWELRYGDPWTRAVSFPNTHEARSLIFGKVFPPELRAWMYQLLAEFASLGLDDIELMDVRETLTNPVHYSDIIVAASTEEAEQFLWAALVDTATNMWRNITEPDWVERPAAVWKPLPHVFTPPGFNAAVATELRKALRDRHTRMSFERARTGLNGGSPEGGVDTNQEHARGEPDVFAFYRTSPRPAHRVADAAPHDQPNDAARNLTDESTAADTSAAGTPTSHRPADE